MVDPVTLMVFAAVATVAAGGVKAVSQISSSKTASRIQRANAEIAEGQAREALFESGEEARRKTILLRRLRGSQRAAFAKSGALPDVGTPLLADIETKLEGERDISLIRRAGQVEAAILRSRANLFRLDARSIRRGGLLAAGGTLLGTAGSVLGQVSGAQVAKVQLKNASTR